MNQSIFLIHPAHAGFLDNTQRQIFGVTKTELILMIIVGLLCAGLGVGMSAYSINEQNVQDNLAKNGIETLATVRDGRVSRGKSTTYYLEYTYDAKVNGDTRTFQNEESVSRDLYDHSEIGGHITVRYLPEDPATVRALDGSYNGMILVLIGSVMVIGGAWLTVSMYRMYQKDRRLERDGQIITGSVVKSSVSGAGNKRQVNIRYEFNSPLGVPLKGSQSQRRSDLNKEDLPFEGLRVAVVYLNDKTYRIL